MLNEICHEIKNWFDVDRHFGVFTIQDGTIDLEIQNDQYFRIVGSVFNDGIYKYPATDLVDEEFDGAVWALAIPNEIILLADEIAEWKDKYGGVDSVAMSPFQSESFGGYSYSKSGGGASDGTTNAGTWQAVFRSRLNKWRKI